MVFSKDLSYFFETEPNALFRIHRRKERVRLPQTAVTVPTYFFESLGYMVPDRHMDPYFAQFVPLTKEMDPKAHMHPGFEFLYILDGELEIQHGDQVSMLEPGDAVYFDAGTPHSYRCSGSKAADAIIVTTHQTDKRYALCFGASYHANSSTENHACEPLRAAAPSWPPWLE